MYERPGRPAGPSRCARVAEAAQREREGEADHKARGGGAPEQLKQRVRLYEAGQDHVPRGSGSHRPAAARRVRDDGDEHAGDAFYQPPGHRPYVDAGTELLQFSPTDKLAETERAIADWTSGQQASASSSLLFSRSQRHGAASHRTRRWLLLPLGGIATACVRLFAGSVARGNGCGNENPNCGPLSARVDSR